MTDQVNIQNNPEEEEFSFAQTFFHYFHHWKWFVLSVIICLGLAFIYLRYTTKEYKVIAKVLIKDDKKGKTIGADMSAFSDLGIIPKSSNLDNEIEVLNSKSLRYEVKDSLNLGVNYYKEGRIRHVDIYKNTPIFVRITDQTKPGRFTISKAGEKTLNIESKEEPIFKAQIELPDQWANPSRMIIPEQVVTPIGILTFEINQFSNMEYPIEVAISNPKSLPDMEVKAVNNMTSSVVNISMITANPQKGQDIINTLIQLYNNRVIEEQNYVATNTIKFIDERLGVISGELSSAEEDVEKYKRQQGLTDLQAQGQLALSTTTEYDRKISDAQIQLNILQSLKDWVMNPANAGAPSNVGLTDQTILARINLYNQEIFNKTRDTKGMTETNPVVMEYNASISSLRDDLIRGISMAESSMQTTLNALRRQENVYMNKALNLPSQERESRELYRQQSIKETLVLYLMQKQEETGLSLAMAVPNAAVVDPADYNNIPVKPRTMIIYLVALLLGFIIPIVVIYIKDMFDNKVHSRNDVQQIVKAPFLGDIPKSLKDQKFPVENVRSAIAEKFRLITSNLRFITGEQGSKVIMVTSTFSNEGKSFVSRNLAFSIATSGKKVLLIDIDMRKSVMDKTLNMEAKKGIAYYLANPEVTLKEVTDQKEFHPNLNIIPVKVFPPNPAELIASDRLGGLFELARNKYDFIIVDTAPIGLVADAFIINKYVDATIFVVRSEVTFKNSLREIQNYYRDNKLIHITTVLNAVPRKKGYGYSYGYDNYGEYNSHYYVENDK